MSRATETEYSSNPFPSAIERNPAVFQENKIVFVSGRVDARDGTPKIICNEIEEIIEK